MRPCRVELTWRSRGNEGGREAPGQTLGLWDKGRRGWCVQARSGSGRKRNSGRGKGGGEEKENGKDEERGEGSTQQSS